MNKTAKVSILLVVIVFSFLLFANYALAAPPAQTGLGDMKPEPVLGLGGEAVGAPDGGPTLTKNAEKQPAGAAVRIDFEVSGHKARNGLYVVQDSGGQVLAYWSARNGWVDSGWISNLNLARDTVWVQVLYYSGPDKAPVTMKILNHAPGKNYGWLSKGQGHALEVAWPDEPLMTHDAGK